MNDQADTAILIRQCRAGNPAALEPLIERYRKPLYGFIIKMIATDTAADDIYQETWLRAIKALHRYRSGNFLSWLFRIAHNLIIDRARKRKHELALSAAAERGAVDPIENLPDRSPAPDTAAARHDLAELIRREVARLPAEQREVFVLRTESDLPFKEIARIQNTSINTALARMQYAVAKLRQRLTEDETLKGAP